MATMTTAIQLRPEGLAPRLRPSHLPALPWRDPHAVPPEKLAEFIASLTEACALNPDNADMRTCLGIAHAMNYDVCRSMERARGSAAHRAGKFLRPTQVLRTALPPADH